MGEIQGAVMKDGKGKYIWLGLISTRCVKVQWSADKLELVSHQSYGRAMTEGSVIPSAVLCPVLSSSGQERHSAPEVSPKEGNKGTGACLKRTG